MSFEQQFTPPTDRRSHVLMVVTVSTAMLLLVGTAVVGLVAFVGLDRLGFGGDDDGPSYPKDWDPRVYSFVSYVENERDLEFKHPVHVEFLSEAEFAKEVTSEEEDLTDEERKEIEQFTGLFRAAGLMEGDVDLFESMNDLTGGGVIGLYDFKDKKIRLRGTELTVSVRKTLVHELTHALQDQHFDLEKRTEEFEKDEDSAASSAYDAVVEGDANRIESAWEAELSKADRAQLAKEQKATGDGFDKATADVPPILVTFMSAPYALGERMLGIAAALDGNDKVDSLFRNPPVSDEHLLDPWTLLAEDEPPAEVDEPEKEKDEKEFDDGTFGAFTWYLMLAERIDIVTAYDAAMGWGGDAYVAFERDGTTCFRADWRGDTTEDTAQMVGALEAWIGALPGGPAKLERHGSTLAFESCDPGKDVKAGKDRSDAAMGFALALPDISLEVFSETEDVTLSRCFAEGVMHSLTLAELQSTDPAILERPAVQRKLRAVGQRCG